MTIDAKNQLTLLDGDPSPSSIRELIQTIEMRQENMMQRAEELLKHQLQTFFEQALIEVDGADDSVPSEQPCNCLHSNRCLIAFHRSRFGAIANTNDDPNERPDLHHTLTKSFPQKVNRYYCH